MQDRKNEVAVECDDTEVTAAMLTQTAQSGLQEHE